MCLFTTGAVTPSTVAAVGGQRRCFVETVCQLECSHRLHLIIPQALHSETYSRSYMQGFWWPLGRRKNIQTPRGTFLMARPMEGRTELVSNMPYMCQ